ncbi:MAG: helix-hairpin-helix domain-containing protein [Dethiosulfatibacter sp.]|nr:helix-hairpin-helix domain-containing protein [Dethiosulfatibacter sp.]
MEYLNKRSIITMAVVLFAGAFYFLFNTMQSDGMLTALQDNQEDQTGQDEGSIIPETSMTDETLSEDSFEDQNQMIYVDIDGAVNNPGVFMVEQGTRLYVLLEAAGGLKDNADTKYLNRADIVLDKQKIYIPEIDEIYENPIIEDPTTSETGSNQKININSASQSELESLSGIGEVLAKRIIEYRNGKRFESIEEIMNVSGIASGKYADIKDYITIN